MICPRCSHDITPGQTICPACRLALSQTTVSTASSSQQLVAEEPRQTRFVWGGFIAIFVGVLSFLMGGGGIVLGLFCVACGIATLVISRFGTRWNALPPWQRALVYPGWIIGWVYIGGLRLAAFIIRAFTHS
jgi:hypothetical protein